MKYFWNSFLITFFFLLFCSTFINVLAAPTHHLCSPDQRDILLQFKDGFQHDKYCIYWCEDMRNVTDSWDMNGDCCFWDGVTCDDALGYVIELDLSCGCLYGEINSISSLFKLRNLSSLNLAHNDFNYSLIPTQFSKLMGLTRLNLSESFFSGQIPMELLHLTKLESLDLALNSLSTEKSFLGKLVYNLTNLKELNLGSVNISSEIPLNISNLSSLRSLCLDHCSLIGEIPRSLFLIPTLQSISLCFNNLKGSLPDFDGNNSLVLLDLSFTSLSGNIPNSINKCKHLTTLILKECNFGGMIPSSLGNLFNLTWLDLSKNNFIGEIPSSLGNLSHLTELFLSHNNFIGEIPSSLGTLSQLTWLDLPFNNFIGEISSSLGNLSHLTKLFLSHNNFIGEIPSSLGNLSQLTWLDLPFNNFVGEIPSSLGNLSNLTWLGLSSNKFVGSFPRFISKLVKLESLYISDFNTQLRPIDLGIFSKLTSLQQLFLSNLNTTTIIDFNALLSPLKSLSDLDISGNNVSTANMSSTSNLPFQLIRLNLASSGITEFPTFIKKQQSLKELNISNNKIKGRVPGWLWDLSSLSYVDLSNNNFSGFDRFTTNSSRWPMEVIDLRSNNFQGPLFVPPWSIDHLLASKNNFSGEIPTSICANYLQVLDLSNNKFNGSLPQCLSNLIERGLLVLNLDNNHLSGQLPDIFINCENLRSLNFGHNQLEGKLPRSLNSCSSLEVLNMEHNKFKDIFPFWLISLQDLQVLVLRSNQFHGSLQYHPPIVASWFPQLRVIDVSHNAFTGILPFDYFIYWSVMFSEGDLSELKYIGGYDSYYQDSMVLMNKGTEMELVRILKTYTAVDFSGNQFKGEIPRSIGLLKGLHALNLSNNSFTGHIPSSMANLTALESLDVSRNQLLGAIPQELGTLSYLAYMNFSHNQLVGPIPTGQQFRTQKCSSFQDNSKLYGPVLDEVCKDIHAKKSQHSETPKAEEDIEEMLSWKAVTIGIGPGIVFGMTIGCILFSYKPKWFMKMFNQKKRRSKGGTH